MNKYLPRISLKKFFNYTLYLKRSTLSQHGFAPILLIALILIGITAGTYLIQTRTNFLPQAASEKYFFCTPDHVNDNRGSACPTVQKRVFAYCTNNQDSSATMITNKIACDAAFKADPRQINYVCNWDPLECPIPKSCVLTDDTTIESGTSKRIGCSSVRTGQFLTEYCEDGKVKQEFFAAGICSPQTPAAVPVSTTASCSNNTYHAGTTTNNCTNSGRVCDPNGSDNGCPKAKTQADCDKVEYYKKYGFVISSSGLCQYPYGATTSGSCSEAKCAVGNTCRELPCPTDQSKTCYSCSPTTQPAAAPNNQPTPVRDCTEAEAKRISCTATQKCVRRESTELSWCVEKSWQEGGSCGTGCIVINGLPKKPYPDNTPPEGCLETDKAVCPASKNQKCTVFKTKIKDKDYWYSDCEATSSTPAGAAPRPAAGAPAANPAAPANRPTTGTGAAPAAASNTKTPWDTEADKNEKSPLIEGVLLRAAKATSGTADNTKDGIEAARKGRDAYKVEFDRAYKDIFKAEISADADARTKRDQESYHVAIHNYVAKENPGKTWDQAVKEGLVAKAAEHLKKSGVNIIPANADTSKITPPNAPSSGATPTKKTINPDVAVNCGSDIDGTPIPCYKMGVFADYDILKATEAEASIATQRYVKSREILAEARKKVNSDAMAAAIDAAEKKLEAAEKAAAACMRK